MNDTSHSTHAQGLPVYRKVLHNFVLMTDRALLRLGEILSLSMTLPELSLCRKYYKIDQKRNPTEEELSMLDRLCATSKKRASLARLTELASEDPSVQETFRDLRQKEAALGVPEDPVQTLEQMAAIAPRYHAMIGRSPTEQAVFADSLDTDPSVLYLRAPDGRAVAHLGKTGDSVPSHLPAGLALCLVTPTEDESLYGENEQPPEALDSLIQARILLGEDGLLGAFLRHTGGCHADLSRLPHKEAFIPEDDDLGVPLLTALTDGYHGAWLWAVAPSDLKTLCELAPTHGLWAHPVAACTDSGRMTLAKANNPYLNCSFAFLRDLCKNGAEQGVHIAAHKTDTPARRLPLTLCHGTEAPTCGTPVNEPFVYEDRLVLPLAVECADNAFFHAMDLVTDALLGLCAKGANRRHVALSVQSSFPEVLEPDRFSESMAAILGLYRAEIELSLPELHSKVEYHGDSHIRLSCTANAPLPKKQIPSTLQKAGSSLFLLSLKDRPDGLPDFGTLRRLCDTVHEHILRGEILSARAFYGSVTDGITAMSEEFCADVQPNADTQSIRRGILIESDRKLTLPLLGRIIPKKG